VRGIACRGVRAGGPGCACQKARSQGNTDTGTAVVDWDLGSYLRLITNETYHCRSTMRAMALTHWRLTGACPGSSSPFSFRWASLLSTSHTCTPTLQANGADQRYAVLLQACCADQRLAVPLQADGAQTSGMLCRRSRTLQGKGLAQIAV